ncbi:MAG TPA: hypothetical protein VFW35_13660 [Sphingomicrobium sp.]|nr:hypothetical protein [Sphingomicrobium sp.]
MRALTHPATLACINPATRSFFDRMFASEVKLGATLSPGFKVASAKPVTGARMLGLLPPDAFAYPVPPTLLLEIEAEDRSHNSATLFHYLARAGDGWFTLDPCPNSRGLQLLSRRKAAGERRLVPTRQ